MKRQLPQDLALERSIARELNGVIGERGAGVIKIQGGDVKEQFGNFGILKTMRPQKGAIDAINSGAPMSDYYPYTDNNILESFRFKNVTPSMENPLPLLENPTNTVQVHTCYVMPLKESMDAVSVREIGIRLKGDGPHDMKTSRLMYGHIQSHPQVMVNFATWNMMMYHKQMEMARNDIDEYRDLTAAQIMADWTFAGVCEFEEMADGSESSVTSGFGNGTRQRAAGYKVLTMVTKGLCYTDNVYGTNIFPGGILYAIVKKQGVIPTQYILQSKPNMASLGGLHMIENPGFVDNLNAKIRPFQMSLICLPRGGLIPAEATMYRDEDDNICYDAEVIRIGQVWSVPIDHVYKECQNYYNIEPLTKKIPDASGGDAFSFNDTIKPVDQSSIMHMRIIYDCDDGLSPL